MDTVDVQNKRVCVHCRCDASGKRRLKLVGVQLIDFMNEMFRFKVINGYICTNCERTIMNLHTKFSSIRHNLSTTVRHITTGIMSPANTRKSMLCDVTGTSDHSGSPVVGDKRLSAESPSTIPMPSISPLRAPYRQAKKTRRGLFSVGMKIN